MNLPKTICASVIGAVMSDSIVPLRYSSLIERIVIAGTRNASTYGVNSKMLRSVAGLPGPKLPRPAMITPVSSRKPQMTV